MRITVKKFLGPAVMSVLKLATEEEVPFNGPTIVNFGLGAGIFLQKTFAVPIGLLRIRRQGFVWINAYGNHQFPGKKKIAQLRLQTVWNWSRKWY